MLDLCQFTGTNIKSVEELIKYAEGLLVLNIKYFQPFVSHSTSTLLIVIIYGWEDWQLKRARRIVSIN